MNADAARNELDPPRQRGLGRALTLALAAHLLLLLALTWGLRWKDQPQNLAVLAELWSPIVQHAAPRPVQPPVPVPPTPQPVQPPVQPPEPVRQPPPAAAEDRDAEIALAQKKQHEAEQQRLAEQRERQRKEKELAEKKAAEEAKRKEQLARAEAEKKAAEAEKKAETARRMEALRHMSSLANEDGTGRDARNAGPSGDYAALIRKLVHDNLYLSSPTPGNPQVVVEVHTGPTGEIISKRIIQSSGIKVLDEAVLRAFDRIQKLPSDKGRYWNPLEVRYTRDE